MFPVVRPKVKQEKDTNMPDQWGIDTSFSPEEHRERVRDMAKQLAAESGLRPPHRAARDPAHSDPATRYSDITPHVETAQVRCIKTPRYDGKANWEAFHAQFELLAQASRWSTEEKALQLAMCLTGDALSSLLLLSPDDRCDYRALVEALKRRFGTCSTSSVLRSELCSRHRRPGEPLRVLANDIEGLVHRTYCHMPPAIQSELARDHFLQALSPSDLRIQTLLAHPKSLQEALDVATERELLGAPMVKDAVPVNMTNVSQTNSPETSELSELIQLVRAATLEKKQRPRPRRQLICWSCGLPGHMARDCPGSRPAQGNEQGTA